VASTRNQFAPARALSLDWWVRDRHGKLVLAQWPNPALWVWLVSMVIGATGVLGEARADTLAAVGQGALIVWAVDELVRGANPFRRLLGVAVLVPQLLILFG
jgi:hypothetical protein